MSRKIHDKISGNRLLLGYYGVFLFVIGIIILLPLITLFWFPSEANTWYNFVIPGGSSIIIGFALMTLLFGKERDRLGKHQDSVLLVLLWVSAVLICAVPFCMIGMNFTDSVFETTSGFCTVGLTRFFEYGSNITSLHIYLMYRSILLVFGGVGLVLVITSAISDRYGLRLYQAEGHNDKLLPNLSKSARMILGIYLIYIILGSIAFIIAGVDVFDAICHSISAVATGGFSTKEAGITALSGNQAAIEVISCVLMVLGATNFLIHMFLFRGKFKAIFKDIEIRFFALVCIIAIPVFVVSILTGATDPTIKGNFGESCRHGVFTFFSSITTTGFSTTNIASLGQALIFAIILINIIGGGAGSTAGGAKQYRFAVAFKSYYWAIRDKIGPARRITTHSIYRFGERKEVAQNEINECYGYIILYVFAMVLGSLIIMMIGHGELSLGDCFFEVSNAISSTGLSVGITNVNNAAIHWVLIVEMLLGRLEILPFYFAGYRIVKDIMRKEVI